MPAPVVNLTDDCSVQGTRTFNREFSKGIEAFTGIRYGEAKRFELPTMAELWKGLKVANKKSNCCLQDLEYMDGQLGPFRSIDEESNLSEDCLHLNIWRPTKIKENEKLPVVVWLCCGHYRFGSANIFGGEVFCCVNRVILVCVSFRLGVFGLAASTDGVLKGNYILYDIITSLQWIQKYIEKFGGDPNQVTLYGSSSASAMITALNSSKMAKGLYHKIICESACVLSPSASVTDRATAGAITLSIMRNEGYKGPNSGEEMKAYLQKLTPLELKNMYYIFISLTMVLDECLIEADPRDVYEDRLFTKVPALIGCVSDEGYTFLQYLLIGTSVGEEEYVEMIRKAVRLYAYKKVSEETGEEVVARVADKYRPENPNSDNFIKALIEIYSNLYILDALYRLAEYHSEFETVYLYEIHYRPSYFDGFNFITMPHSQDQQYKFGCPFLARNKHVAWSDDDKKMSLKLMETFGKFISTGEIPDWKKFTRENRHSEIVTLEKGKLPKSVFNKDNYEFWAKEIPDIIRNDPNPVESSKEAVDYFIRASYISFIGMKSLNVNFNGY